jgi:hypothetical protein
VSNGVQDSNKWGALKLVSVPVIEAGELASISLRYVSGSAGLAPGGYIEIDTDSDSDWAWPQTQNPSADGYLKVVAPEGRAVSVHTPDHKSMIVALQSGEIQQGESIDIILGDRSGGGGGLRSQTFYDPRRNFLCEVYPTGDGTHGAATKATLAISGGNIDSLFAIAPSDIELAPEPATDRAEFTVNFDGIKPGVNPIWVKIVQQDMEMAWISPVFAENLG